MKTSQVGRDLIMQFEGCRLEAYPDPKTGGAPWTCGWGSTGPSIGPGTVWTQEQADERFDEHLTLFEGMVNNAVTTEITQGMFDALVSITYNVGPGGAQRDGIIKLKSGAPSTLLRMVNARDFAGAARQFERWISPGSSVERGLLRRRQAERKLFESMPTSDPILKPITESKPMAPFLLAAIPALLEAVPKLVSIFGNGSEVSQRNARAVEAVVEIAKAATGATNEQDLTERLQDPVAVEQVKAAVEANWFQLTEMGGGIEGARKADAALVATGKPYRSPALLVTLLLMPVIYASVYAVLFTPGFSDDIKAMALGAVFGGLMTGAISGYWFGTSASSARKTELQAQQ